VRTIDRSIIHSIAEDIEYFLKQIAQEN